MRERLFLVLLAALALLPLLGARDLWHSDEPRYAQVAREVLRDGDATVLHLNGQVYREKPPLWFWMAAAAGAAGGDVGPWEARLPSALFAIAGVVLTYELARRLRLGAHALLAASLLATSFTWWWVGQRAALDVVVATWLLAAMTCGETARARDDAGRRGAARAWRVGAAACVGFAFLTKGPPALLFAVVASAARSWSARRRPRIGDVALSAVAFAAVVALWIAPLASRLGFDDLLANFARQTAGRMGSDAPHSQPPWYYLTSLPVDLAPWSVAWLAGAIAWWRARRDRGARAAPASAAVDAGEREARRFLLAFVAACVLLFSCFAGKRGLYLVPLAPALALLTALLLARLLRGADAARRRLVPAAAVVALLLVGGAGFAMPRLDAGGKLGPLALEAASPRPLGAAVARAAGPDDLVVALSLRHPDSLRYYLELERDARGLRPTEPIAVIGLPREESRLAGSSGLASLLELARSRGPRLLMVAAPELAVAVARALPAGADALEHVRSDGLDYVLLRAR